MPGTEVMFIYDKKDGSPVINPHFFNNNLWLTQNQIAQLFDTTQGNVSKHIANIYSDGELPEITTHSKNESVVNRGFRGAVKEQLDVYNLDMIIAVGYRVNSKKATDFRIWATKVLHEYIQKGFALDDERFKQGNKFDKQYFKELRERIRDIRVSEKMLYQQLKDIYALSADYNYDKVMTLMFFATVQNKVHFAITGNTSAELIKARADHTKEHMNLQTWHNMPNGDITKTDIAVAKNYLTEPELKELQYIINMFLDFAEHKADAEEPIFMKEWEQELDKFLVFNQKQILNNAGTVSRIDALRHASCEYAKYKLRIKQEEKVNSVKEYKEDIKELEKLLKKAE